MRTVTPAASPAAVPALPLKAGVVSAVAEPSAGAARVTAGAVRSTVKARLAGVASVLPAGSVARTEKVCAPSGSPATALGELHADHEPLSTRHSKLDPPSVAAKSKL